MKGICISLFILVVGGAAAQKEDIQPGTPAVLTASNGNQARVFLQGLENGKLTFQAFKATRDVTVGISKVKTLTFYVDWDMDTALQQYHAGEYEAMLSDLEPVIQPYTVYMPIDNNLRDPYAKMMEAYRKTGNNAKVREIAAVLVESDNNAFVQRSYVNLALIAIAEGEIEQAQTMMKDIDSEPAKLYLQATIERAEGRPKDAIRTVSGIIINHANDLEWLGPSELLCAYLYMDMLGPDSVITTNSPLHTARQVKNIYSGDSVSADARELWASLGGEAIEAARLAQKEEDERLAEEKRAANKAARAKMLAEEAEKKAAEEQASAGEMPPAEMTDTNLTTTTEEQSE
jgi:hypothetical protein